MIALGCAVGAGLAPASASAQPASAPVGQQVNPDAQQLFSDGQAAAKQYQWDKARALFQAAWRLQQHWKIAVSLGRAELKVGRTRDAAEHLSFFLREVPAGAVTPADRRPVEEMLEQARAKVGAVKVTGAPEGAEVALDGVVVGKAPLEAVLFVEPGPHRIVVRQRGYVDGEGAVAAVVGKEAGVELRMVRVLESKAGGVMGPKTGGGVVVPPVVGPNKGVVIAGAALTAVGIGLGGAFMGVSFSKANDLDEALKTNPCARGSLTCMPDVKNASAARSAFGRASAWSFIAAGAIGAATVTYVLFPRSSTSGNGTTAAISAWPGGLGMTLAGSW